MQKRTVGPVKLTAAIAVALVTVPVTLMVVVTAIFVTQMHLVSRSLETRVELLFEDGADAFYERGFSERGRQAATPRQVERVLQWSSCLGKYEGIDSLRGGLDWTLGSGRSAKLATLARFEHGTAELRALMSPGWWGWEIDYIEIANRRCAPSA